MSLPTADDLFRTTGEQPATTPAKGRVRAVPDAPEGGQTATEEPDNGVRRPSGRVRHDEKMTVYVTSEELLDLEHTRLTLRREHGVAVDRGRLVREAVALVLADFEEQGETSALVRRLREA